MAKDYASKTRKRRKPKRSVSFDKTKPKTKKSDRKSRKSPQKKSAIKLRWLLLLVVIVLLLFAFVYWKSEKVTKEGVANVAPVSYAQGETQTPTAPTTNTKENNTHPAAPINFVFQETPPNTKLLSYYMLQLGTYPADAAPLTKLQKKLNTLKEKFHAIKTVRHDQVQYRLEIGPFYTKKTANEAWKTLYKDHIYSFIRPVYQN